MSALTVAVRPGISESNACVCERGAVVMDITMPVELVLSLRSFYNYDVWEKSTLRHPICVFSGCGLNTIAIDAIDYSNAVTVHVRVNHF
jgi:hypothetical protein